MQFLIMGFDGTDKEAKERRAIARPKHIALGEKLLTSGNFWYGAALLNESGYMHGSMLLMDFPSRSELQAWLDIEPHQTEGVWHKVEIHRCNVRDPGQFNRPK